MVPHVHGAPPTDRAVLSNVLRKASSASWAPRIAAFAAASLRKPPRRGNRAALLAARATAAAAAASVVLCDGLRREIREELVALTKLHATSQHPPLPSALDAQTGNGRILPRTCPPAGHPVSGQRNRRWLLQVARRWRGGQHGGRAVSAQAMGLTSVATEDDRPSRYRYAHLSARRSMNG